MQGGVERTFGVIEEAVHLGPDAVGEAPAEDHLRWVGTFLGLQYADLARWAGEGTVDPVADRVGYRQVAIWASDDELDELVDAMRSLLEGARERRPSAARRRRLLATVVVPDDRPSPDAHERPSTPSVTAADG